MRELTESGSLVGAPAPVKEAFAELRHMAFVGLELTVIELQTRIGKVADLRVNCTEPSARIVLAAEQTALTDMLLWALDEIRRLSHHG